MKKACASGRVCSDPRRAPATSISTRRPGSWIGTEPTEPGIVTSVVETCRITLDQRPLDAAALARSFDEARAASERFASEGGVEVAWSRIWNIAPVLFDSRLVALCEEAVLETCGTSHR